MVKRNPKPLSIVAIGAHMDDCWLGAGATCLKAARKGHRVTFVTAINSYRYWPTTRGREEEIRPKLDALCRKNGIALIKLGHDYMRLVNTPELVGELSGVLAGLDADILFSHAEDEDNQDHTALGAASRIAALHGECFADDSGDIKWPREVYQYTTGWQAKAFHPDTFVDVTDTIFDALAICNNFDDIYAHGRYPTRRLTITDHTQGDRTLSLTDHARFKFAQSIAFGTGCYAEGFVAYGCRCLEQRKLARI
jgi:LmbE family N-acetylglucosaminyl deacetylase